MTDDERRKRYRGGKCFTKEADIKPWSTMVDDAIKSARTCTIQDIKEAEREKRREQLRTEKRNNCMAGVRKLINGNKKLAAGKIADKEIYSALRVRGWDISKSFELIKEDFEEKEKIAVLKPRVQKHVQDTAASSNGLNTMPSDSDLAVFLKFADMDIDKAYKLHLDVCEVRATIAKEQEGQAPHDGLVWRLLKEADWSAKNAIAAHKKEIQVRAVKREEFSWVFFKVCPRSSLWFFVADCRRCVLLCMTWKFSASTSVTYLSPISDDFFTCHPSFVARLLLVRARLQEQARGAQEGTEPPRRPPSPNR